MTVAEVTGTLSSFEPSNVTMSYEAVEASCSEVAPVTVARRCR